MVRFEGVCSTRSVVFHDTDKGVQSVVMVTKFDADEAPHLSDAGFSGVNFMFVVGDGGDWRCHYDPRSMDVPLNSTNMKRFMLAIKNGDIPWNQLVEGSYYTEDFMEEM